MDLNNFHPHYFYRGMPVRRDDGVCGKVHTYHARNDLASILVTWESAMVASPCDTSRLVVDTSNPEGQQKALNLLTTLKSGGGVLYRAQLQALRAFLKRKSDTSRDAYHAKVLARDAGGAPLYEVSDLESDMHTSSLWRLYYGAVAGFTLSPYSDASGDAAWADVCDFVRELTKE